MYTRILVPVDGSTFSESLINPASLLAKATGAELALLRVADDAKEQAEAQKYVERLAADAGATALCKVAQGSVATAIREEAKRVPGTLLGISSHGRSGARQALFGSVALEVLRGLGTPLIAFRPPAQGVVKLSRVSRVVLPLDGSALSESIIPEAATLARWLGARIVVVSAIDPAVTLDPEVRAGDVQESGYVNTKARQIRDTYGIDSGFEVLHGDPKEVIPMFVRGIGDAMLAMTTHGHTGLRGVITGSVAAHCLRDSGVPVFLRLP